MNTGMNVSHCPYCGGEWKDPVNQGGIEKWECRNCGYQFLVSNPDSKENLFALNSFRNEVINLLLAKVNGGRAERLQVWKSHEARFEAYLDKCGGEFNDDPLLAITRAAHITDGFERYEPKEEKDQVETLYATAKEYVKRNPKAENIKQLMRLYRRRLRNKGRNRAIAICSSIAGLLLAGAIGGAAYLNQLAPVTTHPDTGITISIPSDAVTIFEKLGISIRAERVAETAPAYIDAKNALHNETEKFALYDLSLMSGGSALDFDGDVTVGIPLPEGYMSGALKVYHIKSDDSFEEIPATVSTVNNTISFRTDHFSYYAVAERHPIVTFHTDGAGEIDRQIIVRDNLAEKPADPQKKGYTFVGWKNGKEAWDFAKDTVKVDITLKAQWKPNAYTVTLVADGADLEEDTVTVTYTGKYSALPAVVQKPGYTFEGWYTAETGGTQITADTVMNTAADQTLYAHFSKNRNAVVFNANGGMGSMENFSMTTGETAKLPSNEFTKQGFTFLGWSSTPTGDVIYTDRAEYAMGTDASYTLYAVWQINTGTLRFDANGGDGSMDSLPMTYADTLRLPVNGFTRVGYTFVGWSINPDGEVAYRDQEEYTMGDKPEYVLYACWEIKTNKPHFEANGGEGSMSYMTATYNSFAHLPANAFTRPGYHFVGWSTSPEGPVEYVDTAEYKMGASSDYTLYAIWSGDDNLFVFHANRGVGDMPTTFAIETDGTRALPLNRYTRNGYRFLGWSSDEHGEVRYADGADYTVSRIGTVHLYAQWEVEDYTVSFDSNGGSAVADIPFHAETPAFTLPVPSKTGYDFGGWYATDDLGGEAVSSVPVGSYGDRTYYAKWIPTDYEITFHTGGGAQVDSIPFSIESAEIFLPTSATRTGYTFGGWYASADFSGEPVTSVAAGTCENKHFYAKWDLVTYWVRFDAKGGNIPPTRAYTIESQSMVLEPIRRNGYNFLGWYATADLSGEPVTEVPAGSHGDKQFYAKWEPITYTITFETNDPNISYEPITYHGGTLPIDLTPWTPSRKGYTFEGWKMGNQVQLVTSISVGTYGNKLLKAIWKLNYYTVYLDANGGNCDLKSFSYTLSENHKDIITPVREGYTFVGWYDADGQRYSFIPAGSCEDFFLTARWEETPFNVSYVTNGGDAVPTESYTVRDAHALVSGCRRNGYRFLGWYDNEALEGSPVTSIPAGSLGDRIFYAAWEEVTFTVNFESYFGTAVEDVYYTISSPTVTLTDSRYKPSRDYYSFMGWYNNAACTDGPVSAIESGSYGDRTLYAKWEPVKYNATFVTNCDVEIPVLQFTVENAVNLPTNARPGYRVTWYTNPELTGTPVTAIPAGTHEDLTFYADWTVNTYTVTFDWNGGKVPVGQTDRITYAVTEGVPGAVCIDDVTFPSPLYTVYPTYNLFDGWQENGMDFVNDLKENPRNLTLVAKWNAVDDNVITSLGNIGSNHQLVGNRVLIDLSGYGYEGVVSCNKTITVVDADEVILIGHPDATFTGLTLQIQTAEEVRLVLDNFHMVGGIVGNTNNAVIETRGTSSVEATSVNAPAIYAFQNLIFAGDGHLTVQGAHGADATVKGANGVDGGVAVSSTNVIFNVTGTLTLIGGNGGNGAEGVVGTAGSTVNSYTFVKKVQGIFNTDIQTIYRYNQATAGGTGGTGGAGGNGGRPLEFTAIQSDGNGTVNLIFGDGGDGGKGGTGGAGGAGHNYYGKTSGVSYLTCYDPGKGGNAGNGGRGGDAGRSVTVSYSFNYENVTVLAGENGDAGQGGLAGAVGIGGKGGETHATANDHTAPKAADGAPGVAGESGGLRS